MGRDNQNNSSIALLQERFRQLQRVKEMREERELRKMMLKNEPKQLFSSSSTNNIPTTTSSSSYDPTKLFSHHQHDDQWRITPSSRSPPPSQPPHVSLSLWPTSEANNNNTHEDQRSFQNQQVSMDSYSHHAQQGSWKNVYDWDSACSGSDSGVDTSLHL